METFLHRYELNSFLAALKATGLLFVAVLTLFMWPRYFSPLSDIPGPFVASFTRLWHMNRILKGDQNLELIRLHDEFGHFVRIAPNEVSVSHPDALRKILLTPLRKGDWYKIVHFPDRRFKNAMGETDPATKNELSRHLASGYLLSSVLQAEPAIDETVELLLGWLDKHADERRPIDLDRFFTFTTFDIVGEVIFSKAFGFLREGEDIGGAIANSLAHNIYVAVGGYMQWLHLLLSNPFMTWLSILPFGHIFDTTTGAIKEREKNPEARFDAVAHWFRYLEQNPDRMAASEVQSAALNAVAAGADTVACGLQAFVYHVIRRPGLWERIRDEIDEADLSDPGTNKVLSYAEAQKLPLLQACIKEALRVFDPTPMGLPRVAGKGGVTIGGRSFPEGTTLSVSIRVIHRSKEIWGPDASEFRPERWLEDEKSPALEKYYMPFGLGYMSCPGQNLARIELSKISATLVRDYDIRQVNPGQEWQWKAYFTVAPHSWPCYIEKRK
ncbi:Pisatin demethylase [Cytospora mali]|uniref:Pisatin demethylase n=1 Tax=Cytospora mali TaxID=578113 RepID=A0A194W679_CYTMA|nr:Pisatin demethylase [Valsa mali]